MEVQRILGVEGLFVRWTMTKKLQGHLPYAPMQSELS
jgi:hypothetical protein